MLKNLNLKYFVGILLAISLILFFIIARVKGIAEVTFWEFIKILPKVVSIDVAIFGMFAKWGWKWRLFRGWLVRYPNLHGTWLGQAYSDWIDPSTGKGISSIPVMLTIKQSFLSISCASHTAEMNSYSYAESFVIDEEKQLKALAFLSTNIAINSVRYRNPAHDTATYLRIIGKPERELKGCYWTQHNTTGEVTLSFHCKELLEKLPEGVGEHPVLKNENK